MKLCLLGAGGHGKVVADTAASAGHHIVAYADPRAADWLEVLWLKGDGDIAALPEDVGLALGLGAVTPEALGRRSALLADLAQGRAAPGLIHARATVSAHAEVEGGAQVMAGAIVNAGAVIGAAAIVNTGAIVEHDARIGAGAHIAPGAIVLGGAVIGAHAMVGAGAVVLPGQVIAPAALVRAARLAQPS